MLTASSLAKSYGGIVAVTGVSFTAAPGQVVGLLGRNGSGKSTTTGMVTGLLVGLEQFDRIRTRPRDVSFEAEYDSMPQLHLSGGPG